MRSSWKIPHFTVNELRYKLPIQTERRSIPIKLKHKAYTIYTPMVERIFQVYTGKNFINFTIENDKMASYKIGEFLETKKEVRPFVAKKRKEWEKKKKAEIKKRPGIMSRQHMAKIEAMRRKRKKRKNLNKNEKRLFYISYSTSSRI